MVNTYSQIYIHIVFAVENRASLIDYSWEERLQKYITGIVSKNGQKMIAINGMPDHIHFFIGMKPSCNLSELIREIKKSSNSFVNDEKFTPYCFSWQEGYGAFTVSVSHVSDTIAYIDAQKEHHQKKTFQEEYIVFLKKHNIEYDERYIWG